MAKEKMITVFNDAACAIYIGSDRLMPDEEMSIPAEMLELPAFEYLISRGELKVKDDSAKNAEIRERANRKRKADPDAGKTKAQLEDGGEF